MKYHNCPHTTAGNSLAVMLMDTPYGVDWTY